MANELVSSDVTEPQSCIVCKHIKLGGVPDKLYIFPADESLQAQNSHCPGIADLSVPIMTVFFHMYVDSNNYGHSDHCVHGYEATYIDVLCSVQMLHLSVQSLFEPHNYCVGS